MSEISEELAAFLKENGVIVDETPSKEEVVEETIVEESAEEVEEVEETPIEVEETPTEPTESEPTEEEDFALLQEKLLKNRDKLNVPIKWNGVETNLNIDELVKQAQIGINSEIKQVQYKEAIELNRFMKENGLTSDQLAALVAIKTKGKDGLAEFVAKTGIDLTSLRDNSYEIDEEAVKTAKEAPSSYTPPAYNTIDMVYDDIAIAEPAVVTSLKQGLDSIVGLTNYLQDIHAKNDAESFDILISASRNGDFEKVKPYFDRLYINLPASKKFSIEKDSSVFLETYNEALRLYSANENTNRVRQEVREKQALIPRAEKKPSSSKPTSTKEAVAKEEKRKLLESYLADPEGFYQKHF